MFGVTRFLQGRETFGFDSLAILLLLGAHNVSLLESGLDGEVEKLVIGRRSDSKSKGKTIGSGKRVTTYLLGWCHCFERFDAAALF